MVGFEGAGRDAAPDPRIAMDFLMFALFVAVWLLLQHVVLPKLGVPT